MASVKINITVKEELLRKVDEYADENGMTRSGLFSMAVTQYFTSQEMLPKFNDIVSNFVALVGDYKSGKISDSDAIVKNDALASKLAGMNEKLEHLD